MKKIISLTRSILFLAGTIASFIAAGQTSTLEDAAFYSDSTLFGSAKTRVSLFADYTFNGSSLPNYFVGKAYSGSFLDESIKNTAIDRLKKRNRLGMQANGGLKTSFVKNDIRYTVGIGHKEFFSMRYTGDLFRLVFQGNQQFLNQKADVSRVHVKTFNYQYLTLGAEKKVSETLVAGAAISFLRGGRYQNIKTKRGTFFTEEYGTYVELDSDIDIQTSPRDTTRTFESNGLGASLDLYARMVKGKAIIEFSALDLGFIRWKDILFYKGDSTFRYSGIDATDLFSPNSSLSTDFTADSIAQSVGLKTGSKNVFMFLPATLQVSWRQEISGRMSHQVSLRHTFAPGYIPRLAYRHFWYVKPSFAVVNTLAYGGFGRGDYEAGVLYKLKDKFMFTANLHVVEYLALGKHSSGNGFTAGVTALF